MIPILNKDLGPIPEKRRRKSEPSQAVSMGGIYGPGNHTHKKKQVAVNFCMSSDGVAMRIVAEVPQYDVSFSMAVEDNEPEVFYPAALAAVKAKMQLKGFHVGNMDFVSYIMPKRTHTPLVTP